MRSEGSWCDPVQILLDDDPGAPNLLTVSAIRHTETLFLNQANESTKAPIFFSEIDFEWTPHCAQAKDYRVYFSAKNFDDSVQKRFQRLKVHRKTARGRTSSPIRCRARASAVG